MTNINCFVGAYNFLVGKQGLTLTESFPSFLIGVAQVMGECEGESSKEGCNRQLSGGELQTTDN